MILNHNGGLELFAAIWIVASFVVSAQNSTEDTINSFANLTSSKEINVSIGEDVEEVIRSQRRAHRFDTAESSPWVRVYNRFPSSGTDSFFNYETRGNTSAHTSGELWDSLKIDSSDRNTPIDRRESKAKVQDLLRVKPAVKQNTTNIASKVKLQGITVTKPSTRNPTTSTKVPLQTSTASSPKNDSQNKGYIVWTSDDGGLTGGWTLDDPKSDTKNTLPPTVDNIVLKDGSNWKVIGDGGDDGWSVVDDKGDVEWKIEYDEGEWRVTSTGEVPVDAEWVDPEYIWGSADRSVADDAEYNSWPADDYAYSPWVDPAAYVMGIGNHSWPKKDEQSQILRGKPLNDPSSSGLKQALPASKPPLLNEQTIQFGARRKAPEKTLSSAQERTDKDSTEAPTTEAPQSDQVPTATGKSWFRDATVAKEGQKWIQGYGTKTWEGDNTGWNSGFGGQTWITADKDFSTNQWVPKSVISGQIQEAPQNANTEIENTEHKRGDNPIRAWGTGYGSKTWKGNEWDSNVVWKTGIDSALPWVNENNSNNTWEFPDQIKGNYNDPVGKKTIVWSQPIPSDDSEPTPDSKSPNPPSNVSSGIQIKWPSRTVIRENPKSPPSRRTENESWADDSTEGGVVWNVQKTESVPTDIPTGSLPINSDLGGGWPVGNWKINSQEDTKFLVPSKNKNPPKTSNLLSVKWKYDGISTDNSPSAWNQGQWPGGDVSSLPTWLSSGCKVTVKCGSTESDLSDDSNDQSIPPDVSEDNSMVQTDTPQTTIAVEWPKQFYGKNWVPPTKSWRPPIKSWKPPTKSWKPPTTEPPSFTMPETPTPTQPTTMSWENPPPNIKWPNPSPMIWKKPPPNVKWNKPMPPPTMMWTETTTPPPTISWRPSPPMKWKKPGPRPPKSWRPPPTKSWKPPRTKSWKPPTPPNKTWKPSIATPVPDMWTTQTKSDCKDTTETTRPTSEPSAEDDEVGPPQIIIITKLPGNLKLGGPQLTDKWTSKDNTKRKTPAKSWGFPPKKVSSKSSKNRKDKIPTNFKRWPIKTKVSKPGLKIKSWPKGMLPPDFVWPVNGMRRWTTKRPRPMPNWKPPKYTKSKWKQMFRKWMNRRINI